MSKNKPPKPSQKQYTITRRQALGMVTVATGAVATAIFWPREPEVLLAVLRPVEDPSATANKANTELFDLHGMLLDEASPLPTGEAIKSTIRALVANGANVNDRLGPKPGTRAESVQESSIYDMRPTLLMMAVMAHAVDYPEPRKKALETFFNTLIEEGADINAAALNSGLTPLHFAVLQNDLTMVKALLSRPGLNLDAEDNVGYRAFDYAKNKAIAAALKEKGATHTQQYFRGEPGETQGGLKDPGPSRFQ